MYPAQRCVIFCTFLWLLITGNSFSAWSQNSIYYSIPGIDSIVTSAMDQNDIPGISIGIVKDGKLFYLKGYGTRRIRHTEPIDSFTNFLTCSISKLFTATAIMQLQEQGKINLGDKLIPNSAWCYVI